MSDVTISVRHGRHGRHGRQINFWGRAFGRRLTTENFRWRTSPPKTSDGHFAVNGQNFQKKKKKNDSHSERLKHFCFVTLPCAKNIHYIANVLSHKYTYSEVFINYNCFWVTKWTWENLAMETNKIAMEKKDSGAEFEQQDKIKIVRKKTQKIWKTRQKL